MKVKFYHLVAINEDTFYDDSFVLEIEGLGVFEYFFDLGLGERHGYNDMEHFSKVFSMSDINYKLFYVGEL